MTSTTIRIRKILYSRYKYYYSNIIFTPRRIREISSKIHATFPNGRLFQCVENLVIFFFCLILTRFFSLSLSHHNQKKNPHYNCKTSTKSILRCTNYFRLNSYSKWNYYVFFINENYRYFEMKYAIDIFVFKFFLWLNYVFNSYSRIALKPTNK